MDIVEFRWTLSVKFDSIQEVLDSGDLSGTLAEAPLGEAADFYQFVRKQWDIIEPEDEDQISWDGETVILGTDTLDHLYDIMQILVMRYIPKEVKLVRNGTR